MIFVFIFKVNNFDEKFKLKISLIALPLRLSSCTIYHFFLIISTIKILYKFQCILRSILMKLCISPKRSCIFNSIYKIPVNYLIQNDESLFNTSFMKMDVTKQRKIERLYLCRWILTLLILFIILSVGPSLGQNEAKFCCANRDIVFIIDQSGTMKTNDPNRFRWDILNYAINYFDTTATHADRITIIPFGGKQETSSYAKESRLKRINSNWFDLAIQSDRNDLYSVVSMWYSREGKKYHSETTDILSAFEYFASEIDQPNVLRDLYIFFISDGLVDLYYPDLEDEPDSTQKHNAKLFDMLKKQKDRWRLYNICLGIPDSVDVMIHKKMLNEISVVTRQSGTRYPGFAGNVANYPYLLLANDKDKDVNLLKMKQGIGHVLDRGSSLVTIANANNRVINIPGRGSASLQLKFTLLPNEIPVEEFKSRLLVNFLLDGMYHRAKVKLKVAEDRLLASYFDFAIDEVSVDSVLKFFSKKIEDIESWQIGVKASEQQFELLNLEISYVHGWRLVIDRLQVEAIPTSGWNFFRWLFDKKVSCKPILQIHAIAENQCGTPLVDSNATIKFIGDDVERFLNVKKLFDQRDGIGEKYELWAEIDDVKLLTEKLGEKIEIMVTFPAHRYVFQTNTIPVRVCAKYPEVD